MENHSQSKPTLLSLSLLLGLVLLGFFIYKGLKTFSDKDRVVTVKGLAEMNMTAESATINLRFSFSGDELDEIISLADNKKNAIVDYLIRNGFTKKDISSGKLDVHDRQSYYENRWEDGHQVQVKVDRYEVTQSIKVQSKDVTKTEDKSSQIKLDLVKKNLTAYISTKYVFPELNEIKPQLIAESTKNARVAGEQFANDSKAQLGKIKTASQGQITIAGQYYYDEEMGEGSDAPSEPYIQKARVVSTIVFFLD
ncbi:MAG: SIMPL domain-containing protein [Bacteroidia bacterium]|nr:SIMPL domain-containing protein [Bacteroidia bacterium]